MPEISKRQDAFDQYFQMIEAELTGTKEHLKGTSTDMQEASCAMESRYDTFREEAEYMHTGHQKIIMGLRDLKDKLLSIREACLQPKDRVFSGALVTLENTETPEQYRYYVIPGGGGKKIDVRGEQFIAVNPDSNLGKIMLCKEVGDVIKLTIKSIERAMEIIEIE